MQDGLAADNLAIWRADDRCLFADLSLAVGPGELLQVRGANGVGKTTLLRLLCGLTQPEEGRVLWHGESIHADLGVFHSDLAFVGHHDALKDDLTATENLRALMQLRREVSDHEISSALTHAGLSQRQTVLARRLSAGQRRRIGLARLMLEEAPLWILDEPFTHLDSEGRELVTELINVHIEGGGMAVAATHEPLSLRSGAVRELLV